MMNSHVQSREIRSVLLVDDDESFRTVIRQILTASAKYRVRTCDSGEQALEALRMERFDVVVLDYKMSGISGLNVLQWMLEEKIDTPVVMMTAAGSEPVAVEAMKLGAYDYVRKEHVDIDHIDILVSGVYERYLFRREKERREAIEREREKSLVAVETFHSTLASIAQIVNNSLTMVSLNIQEHEMELQPFVNEAGRVRLTKAFAEMKQEYSVIASAVKSMLSMANVLHGNFADANYTSQLQETLSDNLKTLKQHAMTQPLPKK
jgi:FixJ family two-component response regulator